MPVMPTPIHTWLSPPDQGNRSRCGRVWTRRTRAPVAYRRPSHPPPLSGLELLAEAAYMTAPPLEKARTRPRNREVGHGEE